jgi:uncharacterized RDD family membrane protein YckC/uncharacterized membrane protein
MELAQWINVIEAAVFISIPVLLFVELYIGHMDYTGFLERCGFARREVGLLLVGGLVGTALSLTGLYAVPLIIYQGSLLAIDMGGAVIPVVLSVYLIRFKKLNIPLLIVAIGIVGTLTYMTTEFRPSIGIVSEFPYYMFPSFCAIAIALIVYREKLTSAIPFAYASTTLGVLIGADIVRIPQVMVGLEQAREEMNLPIAAGSIGGAGGLDLVFLGGLIAIGPLLLLAPFKLRHSQKHVPPSKTFKFGLDGKISQAEIMFEDGDYKGTVDSTIIAVEMRIEDIGKKFKIHESPYIILDMLSVDPYIRNDYWLLINTSKSGYIQQNDAYRAIITAKHVIREMEKVEVRIYATRAQRIVAFLIDSAIILGIMLTIFYLGGLAGLYTMTDMLAPQNSVWLVAFIMWLWVAQALYFTMFEGWKGHTPGKKLVGLKVATDELEKCSFMDAFTRNVVRLLDMVLFIYAVSLIFMSIYPKRQRIGDMVAKTVVMNVKAG